MKGLNSHTQYRDSLQIAMALHQNGQIQQARSAYLDALLIDELQTDAFHFLGVLEYQHGNLLTAVEYIKKSLEKNSKQPAAHNNLGIVLKELKQTPLAIEHFQKALALDWMDANTHMNLGNAYQAIADYDRALKSYDRSIILSPALCPAIVNRGFALAQLGQHIQAVINYKIALIINPFDPNIYNNLGNSLRAINELELSVDCYSKAIDLNPKFADAYFNKANVFRDLGRVDEALHYYSKAIEMNTGSVEHFINQGSLLRQADQSKKALESFNAAIELRPGYALAYNNRANAYLDLGLITEAIEDYSAAIEFDPQYAQAYNNRGNALRLLGQTHFAKQNYLRAVYLDPHYADVRNNMGVLLMEEFLTQPSIDCFDFAIQLKPDFVDAYFNKANALRELKHFSRAVQEYQKALSLDPKYEFLRGLLLHSKMQICDWSNIHTELPKLIQCIESGEKCTPPFPVLGLVDSLSLQLKTAQLWSKSKFPGDPQKIEFNQLKLPKKQLIRVAYFSSDFRDHPVSYLMADLFEHHDRDQFEIIAFSLGPNKQDVMRKRLEQSFDVWVDAYTKSDSEVVRLAREMQVDIAIDLGGFTRASRTGIFAKRVAPVQVSYIGYLGTMGASYMDYILADEVIIPKQSRQYYSEKIAYLPIYQTNDSKRRFSTDPMSREDLGLEENVFVYCCFNTNYKITPVVFAAWMNILKNVDQSVLLLYADSADVKGHLLCEATLYGVDPLRISFADRLPQSQYLLRYTLADLFLDTTPYNAGTTASDALWSGLPVLTMMGESFASRIASSLLFALGLQELVTYSIEEYQELAIELGRNNKKMNDVKRKLSVQKEKSDLFNTKKFTTNFERVLHEIYEYSRSDDWLNSINK